MAWEEPRKTGMAYRRLGMVNGDPITGQRPDSDEMQAIRVCTYRCSGWADGSRRYPRIQGHAETCARDVLTVPFSFGGQLENGVFWYHPRDPRGQ